MELYFHLLQVRIYNFPQNINLLNSTSQPTSSYPKKPIKTRVQAACSTIYIARNLLHESERILDNLGFKMVPGKIPIF